MLAQVALEPFSAAAPAAMAPTRRTSILPGLAICASLLAVCRVAFVGAPQPLSSSGVALRATEKKEADTDAYKLPKPDMTVLNDAAQVGLTFDQDKRGNMWSVQDQSAPRAPEKTIIDNSYYSCYDYHYYLYADDDDDDDKAYYHHYCYCYYHYSYFEFYYQ